MTFMKYSFYFRIVAAPYIAQNIINGNFPLACGLFVYAGATDFLDGYIARNFKNQSSSLGSFLDPLSDKILVGIIFCFEDIEVREDFDLNKNHLTLGSDRIICKLL